MLILHPGTGSRYHSSLWQDSASLAINCLHCHHCDGFSVLGVQVLPTSPQSSLVCNIHCVPKCIAVSSYRGILFWITMFVRLVINRSAYDVIDVAVFAFPLVGSIIQILNIVNMNEKGNISVLSFSVLVISLHCVGHWKFIRVFVHRMLGLWW